MRRLGWVGWLGLFFLLTIACTFRFRGPTPGSSSSLEERTQEREVVRGVIIVTPLNTLTPTPSTTLTLTPTPTLTPTLPITQAGQARAGGELGGSANGDSGNSGNGSTGGAPGVTASASPVAATPSLPATSVSTVAPTGTSTGLPPGVTPTLPTATSIPPTAGPPGSGGSDDGGNDGTPYPPPLPLVAFSAADFSVNENDGGVSLPVVLNAATGQTVTVTVEDTFTGTADSGDYLLLTSILTFLPGTVSGSVNLSLIDDSLIEGDETIELLLTNPTNANLGTPAQAVVTIVDDDTLTVNSTDDTDDGACNIAHCSLREVINAANAKPGPDTISFNIPSPGPQTIAPNAPLPSITDPVTIDGTTQPGANCDTWPPTLLIELDGRNTDGGGLVIDAGSSTVRGLVINRFNGGGLDLTTNGSNIIECNFIGTDLSGSTALGNGTGVFIFGSPNNRIGGSGGTAPNLISGNRVVGVTIGNTFDTLVQGNFIGTDVTGTTALGNAVDGIFIDTKTATTTVGGTTAGTGNRIAFNGNNGITIRSESRGNRIQRNSIFDNLGLGIDLGPDGITLNDPLDADLGPNDLQNFPVLNLITTNGGDVTVAGILTSTPNTTFRLEIFANSVCDPSGQGEGETFLGTFEVMTDGAGNIFFERTFSGAAVGQFITATATDPAGNTSEFSACQVPSSQLFVNSRNSNGVRRYNGSSGAFVDEFAGGGLDAPTLGLALGPDGNLYVSSGNTDEILRYDTMGAFIDVYASGGGLDFPADLVFGPDGNLYVSSGNTDEILRYDDQSGTFSVFASVGLNEPRGLVFGPDGDLYVSSQFSNAVLHYNGQTGQPMGTFAASIDLNGPIDLRFGPDGNLYVSSFGTDEILRYDGLTGAFIDVFASGGGLNVPTGLTFGPDGRLYVSSSGTNQILRYDSTTGNFIDVFIDAGGLSTPEGLLLAP